VKPENDKPEGRSVYTPAKKSTLEAGHVVVPISGAYAVKNVCAEMPKLNPSANTKKAHFEKN
jgi:hypothetical protein